MICAYCARPKEDLPNCRGCGAKAWMEPLPEPWNRGEPFAYYGYLVKVDRRNDWGLVVVTLWRGTECLGQVEITQRAMLNWPPGVDMMPEVLRMFREQTTVELPDFSVPRTYRLVEVT